MTLSSASKGSGVAIGHPPAMCGLHSAGQPSKYTVDEEPRIHYLDPPEAALLTPSRERASSMARADSRRQQLYGARSRRASGLVFAQQADPAMAKIATSLTLRCVEGGIASRVSGVA